MVLPNNVSTSRENNNEGAKYTSYQSRFGVNCMLGRFYKLKRKKKQTKLQTYMHFRTYFDSLINFYFWKK